MIAEKSQSLTPHPNGIGREGLSSAEVITTGMLKHFPLVFFIVLLASCTNDPDSPEPEPVLIGSAPKLNAKDVNLEDWMHYYRQKGVTFDAAQFELIDTALTEPIQGNVWGSFDPEFDPVYLDFLVYSPDKTKYIDLDSYQWSLGKDNEPAFDADQEINLVDLKTKTVRRIAFRGPSQQVENASWKNDSVVYLLEVSDEQELYISEVNIETGKILVYRYKHKLPFDSDYAQQRLEKKLK
jgi:hypothetical protein